MTIEEAIKTAIQFENKVHAVYEAAARKANDETAQRVFAMLAEEEQGHIAYLEHRLTEWQTSGRLSQVELRTVLPSAERVRNGVRRMAARIGKPSGDHRVELSALQDALAAENETTVFYVTMVRELPSEGQRLFSRFLEIEEGHGALVQAEIDHVNQVGFWFDWQEFDLEVG